MGKYPRRKQKRLGEKLLQIRETLKLSQNEMLWNLGLGENYSRTIVSNYEQDHREPPLFVLLEYARLSGVCLDAIVDDDVDLPKKLPATPKHRGVKISAGRVRTAKKISSRRPPS
jgi:transcriptional regulator with XRE-family HTH domain